MSRLNNAMVQVAQVEKRETAVKCKGVTIDKNGHKHVCGKEGTNHTFHAVYTKNHGVIYMCDECYNKGLNQSSYSNENGFLANTIKKHGLTHSFEVELTKHDDSFARMLQYNNFMPTYGCTVAIEYKSPIYQSLCGIRKLFRSMNKELSRDYFRYQAGTHCNIGHVDHINEITISMLRRFYHSLFVSLSRWLQLNPLACEAIFGRQFTYYASPIDETTNPLDHNNFINLQHDTHIEFRLCKFINEDQYVDCVQLCTRVTKTIIKGFICKFDKEKIDTRRYKSMTEYRLHIAQVTAKRIVELFENECDKKGIPYTSL